MSAVNVVKGVGEPVLHVCVLSLQTKVFVDRGLLVGASPVGQSGALDDADGDLDITMLQTQQEVREVPRLNALNAIHSPPANSRAPTKGLPNNPQGGGQKPSGPGGQTHNNSSENTSAKSPGSNSNSNNNKTTASKLINKLRPK